MTGTTGVCIMSDGYFIRRGNENDSKILIIDRCGKQADTFPSSCTCKAKFCNSFTFCEFETTSNRHIVAHNCSECGRLVIIDKINHSVRVAYNLIPGVYKGDCLPVR